jgi:hypothetical protein
MGLADCGHGFYVPQRPARPVLLAIVVCAGFIWFLLICGPWIVPMVPAAIWLLVLARVGRENTPAPVLVKVDRIAMGARSLAFANVRSVERKANRIVVRARWAGYTLAFDSSDPLVVRHLEARVLLARRGRCKRSERSALEAFYVFGASAVRVQKRTVLEILSAQGPWSPGRGNVYVRSLGAPTSAYRSNARTGAIAVGSLENEFAASVR